MPTLRQLLQWILPLFLIAIASMHARAAPYAYVTSGSTTGTVTVIDTVSHSIVKTINVGQLPTAVAINGPTNAVYVCQFVTKALAVIRPQTLTSGSDIPTSDGCNSIGINKSGSLVYATDNLTNRLLVLNTPNNQVASASTGASPKGLVLNSDGTLIYVVNSTSPPSISVFRPVGASAPTLTRTIPLGATGTPIGVEINRVGTVLYVMMSALNAVYAVDLTKDTFVSIPVGNQPQQGSLAPDGRHLWVTNLDSSTVSIIDTQTNTVVGSLPVGPNPSGIDFTTDGTFVYTTNTDIRGAGNGSVSVIRAATRQVEKTIPVGFRPAQSGRFIGPREDNAVVPNVVGQTQTAASAALVAAGLAVGTVTTQSSTTVTAGNVISQTPGADASVLVGSTVNLVISSGTGPYASITVDTGVSVIDVGTQTLLKTVSIPAIPISVGVGTTEAYACKAANASIETLTLSTLMLGTMIGSGSLSTGGLFCRQAVVNKAGTRLYGSNSNTVATVDTATKQFTNLTVAGTTSNMVLSPDNAFLYATTTSSSGVNGIAVLRTSPSTSLVRNISLGSTGADAPAGIEINQAGTMLYVANSTMNVVHVVDLTKDTFVNVPVGTKPMQLALHPGGRFLYVTNNTAGTVSIIDTLNNTVTSSITVGPEPTAIDFTPDGTFAYVVYKAATLEGGLAIIRTSTNVVEKRISLRAVSSQQNGRFIGPRGTGVVVPNATVPNVVGQSQSAASMAIVAAGLTVGTITQQSSASVPAGSVISQNPAAGTSVANGSAVSLVVSSGASSGGTTGPYAFVPNFDSNTVTIIDTATNTLVKTMPAGTRPIAVGVTSGTVFVCAYGSPFMPVLKLADLSAGGDIPVPQGCQCMASNKAGTTVYASGGQEGFFALDVATRNITPLQMPWNIGNLQLSPDESTLYATHPAIGKISVIRTAPPLAITRTITVAGQPYGMDIDRTGKKLYVAIYDKSAVNVYDLTNDSFVTIPVGKVPAQIALTPDGKFLYVANSGSDTISIIDTQTNTVSSTFNTGKQPYGVDFSNDGTFAYVINQDPTLATGNVQVVRTATSQVEKTIATGKLPQAVGRFVGPRTDPVIVVPTAPVIEFYNTPLDHYFITADANEAAAIDKGSAGPGWSRTGDTFPSGGSLPVCRFFGNINGDPNTGTIYGPSSHFYAVQGPECDSLKAAYNPKAKSWHFESNDFMTSPPVNAGCTSTQIPIYRAYNNGFSKGIDSNHRLTPNQSSIQQVVARGWVSEGVVMCAPK